MQYSNDNEHGISDKLIILYYIISYYIIFAAVDLSTLYNVKLTNMSLMKS